MRITGFKMLIGLKHRREDAVRAKAQAAQKEALEDRHDRELKDIARRERALDAIDAREKFSLETTLRREAFQKSIALPARRPPAPALQPEFENAATPPLAATGDERRVRQVPVQPPVGSVQPAETLQPRRRSAAAGKARGRSRRSETGEARRLRDQVLRRRGARDPDRDRER